METKMMKSSLNTCLQCVSNVEKAMQNNNTFKKCLMEYIFIRVFFKVRYTIIKI